MTYRVIDKETYYRKGVFRHFTEDCKCSTSITAKIDVTELVKYSKENNSKFYVNFLYILSKVLNSRDDYRMGYLWQTEELICYDVIHPTQYIFHEDTETCTPVYTNYDPNYEIFYRNATCDIEKAKQTREYGLDMEKHPNWFDASYISWLSYDSLNIELPDGFLYFLPIINWGKYREENARLMMPVTVRMNHAVADGYLVANVFRLLEKEMDVFCGCENSEANYMKVILETERLFLREMNMDDFDALYVVLSDPSIMQHYPYTFDEKRVREWIERNMKRYEENGFGLWAVCLKDTGEMIGDCGLTLQNIDGEILPEIGYHIRRDCQCRGYAKEAASAVRSWAFQNTDYPALYSYCKNTNIPSIKTAEAIGMHFDKEYPDEANEITHVSVINREDMGQ